MAVLKKMRYLHDNWKRRQKDSFFQNYFNSFFFEDKKLYICKPKN